MNLPELPEKSYLGDDASYGYDAEDMRAYAAASVAKEREKWRSALLLMRGRLLLENPHAVTSEADILLNKAQK